eukprot:4023190-Amphidinium_carterae.1
MRKRRRDREDPVRPHKAWQIGFPGLTFASIGKLMLAKDNDLKQGYVIHPLFFQEFRWSLLSAQTAVSYPAVFMDEQLSVLADRCLRVSAQMVQDGKQVAVIGNAAKQLFAAEFARLGEEGLTAATNARGSFARTNIAHASEIEDTCRLKEESA